MFSKQRSGCRVARGSRDLGKGRLAGLEGGVAFWAATSWGLVASYANGLTDFEPTEWKVGRMLLVGFAR